MSIDLSQFHQVFYEESFEGLDSMESNLLNLNIESVDEEMINTIFRSAHSIKGGAGTFGFMQISDFTHVVETLLDEIRSNDRSMEQHHVDLFLESVDCLRSLLNELQGGLEPDMSSAEALKFKFNDIFTASPVNKDSEASNLECSAASQDAQGMGWLIEFKPSQDILCTGNEPYRMFRELEEMAGKDNFYIEAHLDNLPNPDQTQPEMCYLFWTIRVELELEVDDLKTVFEWVSDDSEITYTPIDEIDETLLADNKSEKSLDNIKDADSPDTDLLAAEEGEGESPRSVSLGEESALAPAHSQTQVKVRTPPKNSEAKSVRVSTGKIDSLINMVGELVITQSMLGQLGQDFDMDRVQKLQEGLSQLEQNTRELQESVMKIRMLPISFIFSRFPRLVRDMSRQMGKEIDLVMQGENTELDKSMIEKIGDPLIHLVRNSLDHGLERPDVRKEKGKNEVGTISLNSYHQGGNIVIEIQDDGAGLNHEVIRQKALDSGLISSSDILSSKQIEDLIFRPGFSTAESISDISGRGVGMDVVSKNINELNGTIEVNSTQDEGSVFTIRLPLTLSILDGQLVRVGGEVYIFPLVSIVESLKVDSKMMSNITGNQYVMKLRDDYIPIVSLHDTFSISGERMTLEDSMLVVVEGKNEKIGVIVDELLGQQQVVIKSLEQNYKKVDSISGATILGDGTVALIVDLSELKNNPDTIDLVKDSEAA